MRCLSFLGDGYDAGFFFGMAFLIVTITFMMWYLIKRV